MNEDLTYSERIECLVADGLDVSNAELIASEYV